MFFLKNTLFNSHSRPAGLDVSDLSLKLVQLEEVRGVNRVVTFASVPLSPGVVVDGEILKEEMLLDALRTLFSQAGSRASRRVICSLPEMKVFLRLIFMPQMEAAELRESIRWELEGNIPLPLDQIYYDHQVLDQELRFLADEKHQAVLVVAVARHIVDQYVSVIERAGIEVVGLETESIAQARIFAPEHEDPPRTALIVDFGDRRTSFLIAVGNVPIFTSSSHLSSQMVTDGISKAFRISFAAAEKMKLEYGLTAKTLEGSVLDAVMPTLESLVGEISRSVDFYTNSLKYTPSIDRIILCGGGANLQGIIPYMVRRLRKPVEFGDPWVNMPFGERIPALPREQTAQFSTALGLALGGKYSSVYAHHD